MNDKEIFKYRYEKLGNILEGQNAFELLDLALILRQMLVDGYNLLDALNANLRLKINFNIYASTTKDFVEFSTSNGLPIPEVIWFGDIDSRTKYVNKDSFLKNKILFFKGKHFSVRQIIKACANRLGGVHLGKAEQDNDEELIMRILNNNLHIGGAPSMMRALHSIGMITFKALNPLYEKICNTTP